MANQLSVNTRMRAAMSKRITPSAAYELAHDEAEDVRVALASNDAVTDAGILRLLAQDRNDAVREAVAMSDALTSDMLAYLATDHVVSVREYVAGNRATPPDRLSGLLEDESEMVRQAALTGPRLLVHPLCEL